MIEIVTGGNMMNVYIIQADPAMTGEFKKNFDVERDDIIDFLSQRYDQDITDVTIDFTVHDYTLNYTVFKTMKYIKNHVDLVVFAASDSEQSTLARLIDAKCKENNIPTIKLCN